MKPLNKAAGQVMDRLTEGLDESNSYRKFDNGGDAIMAACVELIGSCESGPIFSVAHYFEQNGDLCADPDMTFLHGKADGKWYPMTFQMAIPPVYDEAVIIEDGRITKYAPGKQSELVDFANQWMKNIKWQQDL